MVILCGGQESIMIINMEAKQSDNQQVDDKREARKGTLV